MHIKESLGQIIIEQPFFCAVYYCLDVNYQTLCCYSNVSLFNFQIDKTEMNKTYFSWVFARTTDYRPIIK
jgi:hypothetical protein